MGQGFGGLRSAALLVVIAAAVAATPAAAREHQRSARDAVKPGLSPITATFVSATKETDYAATITSSTKPPKGSWTWSLQPPLGDAACKKFEADATAQKGSEASTWQVRAAWHHANEDGCSHSGAQHQGTVTLLLKLPPVTCAASYFGTLDNTGPPAVCSEKRCDDEVAAVARARARLTALEQEKDRLETDLAWAKLAVSAAERALDNAKAGLGKADEAAKAKLKEIAREGLKAVGDVLRIEDRLERIQELVDETKADLRELEKKLAACEAGRELASAASAASSAACGAELSALAAAEGRAKAYRDVRGLLSKRLLATAKADEAATAAGLRSLAGLLPPGQAARARSVAARFDAAVKALGRLERDSKSLDGKLLAAGRQVVAAGKALSACRATGR